MKLLTNHHDYDFSFNEAGSKQVARLMEVLAIFFIGKLTNRKKTNNLPNCLIKKMNDNLIYKIIIRLFVI